MLKSADNPILADLRAYWDFWTPDAALDSITDMSSESVAWDCTREQLRDAERVLTRMISVRNQA